MFADIANTILITVRNDIADHRSDLVEARSEALEVGDTKAVDKFQAQIDEADQYLADLDGGLSYEEKEYWLSLEDTEVSYSQEKFLSNRSTDEWRALLKSDPEQFASDMKVLGEENPHMAQMVTMGIQEAVQSENRMWSMMTAMSQAEHDTAKAIISNFRV